LSTQRPALSQAPLIGLARTLAIEQPASGWVRVDLDPDAMSGANAAALTEELLTCDDEGEIAFRHGLRYARRLARASVGQTDGMAVPVRSDATYLITGGLGALGLIMARFLVERGARHLVLVGRNGARDKAAVVVAEFERRGVSVRVARTDVADESQMKTLFADIGRSMPPLAGLIHAAAVIEDGLIEQLTRESFDRVFAPKVEGAWRVHALTENLQLDFFVLFSSAASFFGSPGQANYSAANSFLDALAAHRHALGLPALSVNWGPWESGGIDAKTGPIAFERALNSQNPAIAVVRIDWTALGSGEMPPALRSFAASFIHETVPGTAPESKPRAVLLQVAAEERAKWVLDHISRMVARILSLPQDALDLDQGLGEYGFDSLMALELKNQLESDLEIGVSTGRLLTNPSVRELTRLVTEAITTMDFGNAAKEGASEAAVTSEIEEGEL
jgi:short-subunit dehydrogenase/acyl carrier protein